MTFFKRQTQPQLRWESTKTALSEEASDALSVVKHRYNMRQPKPDSLTYPIKGKNCVFKLVDGIWVINEQKVIAYPENISTEDISTYPDSEFLTARILEKTAEHIRIEGKIRQYKPKINGLIVILEREFPNVQRSGMNSRDVLGTLGKYRSCFRDFEHICQTCVTFKNNSYVYESDRRPLRIPLVLSVVGSVRPATAGAAAGSAAAGSAAAGDINLNNVIWPVDMYQSMETFEPITRERIIAKLSSNTPGIALEADCGNFVRLCMYLLNHKIEEKFTYSCGLEILEMYSENIQVKLITSPFVEPLDDLNYTENRQWIVSISSYENIWFGMTPRGVLAFNLADWISYSRDRFYEDVRNRPDQPPISDVIFGVPHPKKPLFEMCRDYILGELTDLINETWNAYSLSDLWEFQNINRCFVCNKQTLFKCIKCMRVHYCGKSHRDYHFIRGHKEECTEQPPPQPQPRVVPGSGNWYKNPLYSRAKYLKYKQKYLKLKEEIKIKNNN